MNRNNTSILKGDFRVDEGKESEETSSIADGIIFYLLLRVLQSNSTSTDESEEAPYCIRP